MPIRSDPVPHHRFGADSVIETDSFRLERYRSRRAAGTFRVVSDCELVLVAAQSTATLTQNGRRFELPRRSIAMVPAGESVLRLPTPGEIISLAPSAAQLRAGPPPYRRLRDPGLPVVHMIDEIPVLPHNPRMRILQGEALSINWTEYDGPRDPRKLSPHLHDEFSQGALVVEGRFTHHLRWPWSTDSTRWRNDRHRSAGPGDFVEIPAGVIHTSEGFGPGHHHLIEMFCPPRLDFRAKGWIANAGDYTPSGEGGGSV